MKVDLRTITLNVPPQEVITKDNVTVKVNAVAYFRVVDAARSIVQVENYLVATSQIAQTTLRSVLGQVDLDQLLSERDQINERLQTIIDEQTEPWGVKVGVVEVKDVELPSTMQRAIARQAEAERERRAKIIAADGEFQASEKLSQAASVIRSEPGALQLRYLQTMNEIGSSETTTTLILPFPVEMLEALSAVAARNGRPGVYDKRERSREASGARDLERLHQLRAGHDPRVGGARAAAERRQLPHALARDGAARQAEALGPRPRRRGRPRTTR